MSESRTDEVKIALKYAGSRCAREVALVAPAYVERDVASLPSPEASTADKWAIRAEESAARGAESSVLGGKTRIYSAAPLRSSTTSILFLRLL